MPTEKIDIDFTSTSNGATPCLTETMELPESSKLNEQGVAEFLDSELVIAFVGAVGADIEAAISVIEKRLKVFNYSCERIRISHDVFKGIVPQSTAVAPDDEYARINEAMNRGNWARESTKNNAVLAIGAAAQIASRRKGANTSARRRHAYIIDSLKHPEEVAKLRSVYPQGFYLIGVHSDRARRRGLLVEDKRMSPANAEKLMDRDEDEKLSHGQRTRDTFHLSDFFVRIDGSSDQLIQSTWRILDILFAAPHRTPTFDEYAMFMAFSASLRSADLSRQVGAVISRRREIITTGANDCPSAGGGLYWPEYNETSHSYQDAATGRDYQRGSDSNKDEQHKIINEIVSMIGESDVVNIGEFRERLTKSQIADLTEYGRVVHAEMEAILACARIHESTRRATLYCTTFPCHNCAKHIIAAGIVRVVYVEPYPKSKAEEFHSDAITLEFSTDGGVADEMQTEVHSVRFEPFVGVGPRRFFDLFSTKLGSGRTVVRKSSDGKAAVWQQESANLRLQMLPDSYLGLEMVSANEFNTLVQVQRTKEASNG